MTYDYLKQQSQPGIAVKSETPQLEMPTIELSENEYNYISRFAADQDDPQKAIYDATSAILFSRQTGFPVDYCLQNLDILSQEQIGEKYQPTQTWWKSITNSYRIGELTIDRGNIGKLYAQARHNGEDFSQYEAQMKEIDSQILARQDNIPRSWITKALKATAQSIPYTANITVARGAASLVGRGITALIPGIADNVAERIIEVLAGVAGTMKTSDIMWGSMYYDMINNGIDENVAWNMSRSSGVASGLIETFLEKLTGGVSRSVLGAAGITGGSVVNNLFSRMYANGSLNSVGLILTRLASTAVGEGSEEFVEEIKDKFFENLAYTLSDMEIPVEQDFQTKEGLKNNMSDALDSFVWGALSGIIMGAPFDVKNSIAEVKTATKSGMNLKAVAKVAPTYEVFSDYADNLRPSLFEGKQNDALWENAKQKIYNSSEAVESRRNSFNAMGDIEESETFDENGNVTKNPRFYDDEGNYSEDKGASGAVTVNKMANGLYFSQDSKQTTAEGYSIRKFGNPEVSEKQNGKFQLYGQIEYSQNENGITIENIKFKRGVSEADMSGMVRQFLQENPDINISWDATTDLERSIKEGIEKSNGGSLNFKSGMDLNDHQAVVNQLNQWMGDLGQNEPVQETVDAINNGVKQTGRAASVPGTKSYDRSVKEALATVIQLLGHAEGKTGMQWLKDYIKEFRAATDEELGNEKGEKKKGEHLAATRTSLDETTNSIKATIYFGKKANYSSFEHELHHVVMMQAQHRAEFAKLFQKYKNDKTFKDFVARSWSTFSGSFPGVRNIDQLLGTLFNKEKWSPADYEFEASLFEAYRVQNQSYKNKQLSSFFGKIASWMKQIYQSIRRHADLNPELAQFYDRLYGAEGKQYEGENLTFELRDGLAYTSESESAEDVLQSFKDTEAALLADPANFDSQGRHLAPNGKPSNLTYKQWITVRTPQFIRWFGDWINDPENASKMIDTNGEPIVFYHGSYSDFDTFERSYIGTAHDSGFFGAGFYFAFHNFDSYHHNRDEASYYGPVVKSFFLNIRNPFDVRETIYGRGGSLFKSDVKAMLNVMKNFPEVDWGSPSIWKDGELQNYTKEEMISLIESKWDFAEKHSRIIELESEQGKEYVLHIEKENPSYEGDVFSGPYETTREEVEKEKELTIDRYVKEELGLYDVPYSIRSYMEGTNFTDVIKQRGFDGIVQSMAGDEAVVFNPNQIKSATDNSGEFSRENDSILYSTAEGEEQKRDDAIEELLESSGMDVQQRKSITQPEAKEVFRKIGSVKNLNTGVSAKFSPDTAGKLFGHKGVDFSTIIDSIESLFKDALYLGFRKESSSEHHNAKPNIKGIGDYLNKFRITEGDAEGTYLIRFAVRENNDPEGSENKNILHSAFISDFEIYKEKGVETEPIPDIGRGEQFKTPVNKILLEYLNGVKKRIQDRSLKQTVYHGSPAEFESFDSSHIGEGEGHQAFGWGLYLTNEKGIAESYAENKNRRVFYKGQSVDASYSSEDKLKYAAYVLSGNDYSIPKAKRVLKDKLDSITRLLKDEDHDPEYKAYLEKNQKLFRESLSLLREESGNFEIKKARNLYTVNIPDDTGSNYLYWDKVKSQDLSRIREAVVKEYDLQESDISSYGFFSTENGEGLTGEDLYNTVVAVIRLADRKSRDSGGAPLVSDGNYSKAASQFLNGIGYVGINYPAGTLSNSRSNARNYVIFNDGDISMTNHVLYQHDNTALESYGGTLVVTHNLTEDNMRGIEQIGGMPMPSLAVTKPDINIDSFGPITLVGDSLLARRLMERGEIFDRDMWSPTVPKPKFKVDRKSLQKFDEWIRNLPYKGTLGVVTTNALMDYQKDSPSALASFYAYRDGIRLEYCKENNIGVDIPYRPVRYTYDDRIMEAAKDWGERTNTSYLGYEQKNDFFNAIESAAKEVIAEEEEKYKAKTLNKNLSVFKSNIARSYLDFLQETLSPDNFSSLSSLLLEARSFQKGKTEIDTSELAKKLNEVAPSEKVQNWLIDKKFKGIFSDPVITLGKKKVPYNAQNIFEFMSKSLYIGNDLETITYSNSLAASSGARALTDRLSIAEKENLLQNTKDLDYDEVFKAYHDEAIRSYKYEDVWEALDDSNKAIANYLKSDTRTVAEMKKKLKSLDFNPSDTLVSLAMKLVDTVEEMPRRYFEAKPRRIMQLSDFKYAIVPTDASPDAVQSLKDAGLSVVVSDSREDALQNIAKEDKNILFQSKGSEISDNVIEGVVDSFISDGKDDTSKFTTLAVAEMRNALLYPQRNYNTVSTPDILYGLRAVARASSDIADFMINAEENYGIEGQEFDLSDLQAIWDDVHAVQFESRDYGSLTEPNRNVEDRVAQFEDILSDKASFEEFLKALRDSDLDGASLFINNLVSRLSGDNSLNSEGFRIAYGQVLENPEMYMDLYGQATDNEYWKSTAENGEIADELPDEFTPITRTSINDVAADIENKSVRDALISGAETAENGAVEKALEDNKKTIDNLLAEKERLEEQRKGQPEQADDSAADLQRQNKQSRRLLINAQRLLASKSEEFKAEMKRALGLSDEQLEKMFPLTARALDGAADFETDEEFAKALEDKNFLRDQISTVLQKYRQLLTAKKNVEVAEKVAEAKQSERYKAAVAQKNLRNRLEKVNEDLKKAYKERQALKKAKALKKALARKIMRPVSNNVNWKQARQIMKIQAQIDPNFTSRMRVDGKMMDIKEVRWLFTENPDNPIFDSLSEEQIAKILSQNLNDLTIEQLEVLAMVVDNLRAEGLRERQAYLDAQARVVQSWRDRFIAELMKTGKTSNNPPMKGSQEEAKQKTSLRQRFKNANYALLNMARKAQILDNHQKGAFYDLLIRKKREVFNVESRAVEKRIAPIEAYMKEHKIEWSDFYKMYTVAVDGWKTTTLSFSELLYFYLGANNEKNKQALAYGNLVTDEEKKLIKDEAGAMAFDTEKDKSRWMAGRVKKLGDARYKQLYDQAKTIIDSRPELKPVIEMIEADLNSEAFERVREIMLRVFNQEVGREEYYLPMRRNNLKGKSAEEMLYEDIMKTVPGTRASRNVKKGMTEDRIVIAPINQSSVTADFVKVWADSVVDQEHLVAALEYTKLLNSVFGNSNDSAVLRSYIKQVYGDAMVKDIDTHLSEIANPNAVKDAAGGDDIIRYLRGSLYSAYLGFRTANIVNQAITSPAAFLGKVNIFKLMKGYLAMMAHPVQMWNAICELSPFMKSRSIDPTRQMIRDESVEGKKNIKTGNKAKDAFNKVKDVSATVFNDVGLKGLDLIDRFAVAGGWWAIYQDELSKLDGGNTEENQKIAAQKADEFVYETQPLSDKTELAPFFKEGGEGRKLLTAFQTSLNVVWNNITFDIPQGLGISGRNFKEKLQNGEFAHAIGMIVGYAISGTLLLLVTEGFKDDDDDKDKIKKIAYSWFNQPIAAIPLVSNGVDYMLKRMITGEKGNMFSSNNYPLFDKMIRVPYNITEGDWEKAWQNAWQSIALANGLPYSAINDLLRIKDEGLGSLLGRRK